MNEFARLLLQPGETVPLIMSLKRAALYRLLPDEELVDFLRVAISEAGYRIQGTGQHDETVSLEGHIDGMRKVCDLIKESLKED